ncbi:MAG: adenylate/guanylate cyclase domain-containing protein [Roseofilum sp. SBFL]|uniref:adenylate/guanylate cyclase domain-containing protein n=1 Tax=unclassified Roseofilum TaxID=2620099 RepID=UPI001B025476|nr:MULTISPECIES: adenylate/guanylate cyclase domain-containing protein [unclassified Roseofilum]MBP0012769.1 adenylate/guanylate cyclase domain-containing protein [Roseofilum sp. SID3]MBP0025148.1 adenylate/guanylate cyclase domain-containing protein [Roseofilum sp. SID2]MBP0039763.1 adenylate/guanylate cyclase domain-containing protein [Roseofilum sp. SID1]MBP0044336.1 adenylate/guanylate cyclase domain-containing protein [Roseofilum sp. SBFL]
MSIQFSTLVNLLSAQLSRKIAGWVFLSLMAIEGLILIPSYSRQEQQELMQLEEVSSAVIDSIVRLSSLGMDNDPEFYQKLKTITEDSIIVGVTIYDRTGKAIYEFGELPEISFEQTQQADIVRDRTWNGLYYDVSWSGDSLGIEYTVVARHNAERIQPLLNAYKLRILGLIIIIAIVVTSSTLLVLGITVIIPILRLRDDLIAAGEALSNPDRHPVNPQFYSFSSSQRSDELGAVMQAFYQMFCRVYQEQEKSERLLLNILPQAIASQLRNGHSTIANGFAEVTILFADLVGFTQLAERFSPSELVGFLNQIFSRFDALTEKYHLEKIKTIGDAYMVAGGIPMERSDHAEAIANMALEMQESIEQFNHQSQEQFKIRIGINTGPVVAGVIGTKKFSYDLWGDAVNTASRMESHGLPGKIQVSQSTYEKLQGKYEFQERGKIPIKGKSPLKTYFLIGKLQSKGLP